MQLDSIQVKAIYAETSMARREEISVQSRSKMSKATTLVNTSTKRFDKAEEIVHRESKNQLLLWSTNKLKHR